MVPPLQPARADFLSRAEAPLYYQDSVRESLHRYKFDGVYSYAAAYGRLMSETVRERMAGSWDVLSWVPLSARRLRRRGYDQAKLLAQALGGELGTPVTPLLEKIRDVPPQSGAGGPAARRANISGCYRAAAPARTAGQRILLVDDIFTTGATLSECARILLLAGARDVSAVTLARGRDEPERTRRSGR